MTPTSIGQNPSPRYETLIYNVYTYVLPDQGGQCWFNGIVHALVGGIAFYTTYLLYLLWRSLAVAWQVIDCGAGPTLTAAAKRVMDTGL